MNSVIQNMYYEKLNLLSKLISKFCIQFYIMTMTMTMTMKISLFDINHLNTMIRENKAEKNNVVNEQETGQNNIKCRYRRPTP